MKRFYKILGLIILFGVSTFFFGQSIPNITVGTSIATSLQDSTFPLMYLQLGKYTVNTLHGYSIEMYSGAVRESITPLDTTKTFTAKIAENESSIKKLDYELRDLANDKVVLSNSLTAFNSEDSYKTLKIKLDTAMETSTEYGLKITLTTSYSKKIHFYTRVKYYDSNCYLKEKLSFVKDFHDATFDGGKSLDIQHYLEPNTEEDNNLAKVTISSSYKMVTWWKLKPNIITECVPTIKEINIETAAIEQNYFVSCYTDSGKETYLVKEFYRVRYTSNRIYLLYFQRTMETMFNPDLTSLTQSDFKIGISNIKDLDISTSDSNKKVAFVRNGSLWYYDMTTNALDQVFSFEQNSKDYLRDYYDQHDIRILNIDDKGNISFVVYGYMNCGDYEGRVGILLYDYNPQNHQITERVYIPLTTTYQLLKEDFGDYCYVNSKNIFYFSLNDKVYSYNIASKRYDVLTDNANNDNFAMLEAANCFVWTNGDKSTPATDLTILDLNTEKRSTISSKSNQSIRVLGSIDANIVYGFVNNSDIYESSDGETVSPVYKMIISDCSGNVLKTYKSKKVYVTHVNVDDNVIRLKRIKKSGNGWIKAKDDSILKQKIATTSGVVLKTRRTDKMQIEKYLSMPAGYVMEKMPKVSSTKYVMVTENTTLHLNTPKPTNRNYYVYAYGGITAALNNTGEAIQLADVQMGVVMDSDNHIVWERGGKFNSKIISGISKTYANGGTSSIKACAHMLLQAAQVTTNVSSLKGKTTIDILNHYLDSAVNLSGCTVDEVLYFVSNSKPVIAMKDNSHAVLITGYDLSTVSWFDPSTGGTTKMSLINAEKYFENAGYVFISYITD